MIFKFLTVFLSLGFVAKILGEVVHEVMGHGLFVLAFGGRITNIRISLLWPYELSHIGFVPPPGGFQPWQEVLVDGGGIIMCLAISFILQAILLSSLSKRAHWAVSSTLFWLAFWTFINPAGYLVVGGIKPFGDIADLISAGVMTQELAFILGFLIFLVSLFTLSKILSNVLRKAGVNEDARWSIVLFWLIVPLLTLLTVVGRRQPLLIALLGFIPPVAACAGLLLRNLILSRRKNRETRV
ncbi:MAG: hypothetical protein ACOC6O_02935 [Chloroflexota bacterium]